RVAWSPRGDGLWMTADAGSAADSTFWFVTAAGKARVAYRIAGRVGAVHDVARDGRVLTHHGLEFLGGKARMRGEPTERDSGIFSWSEVCDISADGSKLLMGVTTPGEALQTFLRPARGGPPVRLSEGWPSALSPDGRWALVELLDPFRSILTPVGP